ncbi:hypothetical protein AMATHDRAFT_1553 [Amanita thiersii Skay4041]|uniref:Nudix hydrolase domain-containing protein n=1 Tax=Amanita thiersii Skay4041 TaxID=703135 RepID=A0A2A9NRF7_9AGAR|nr:hypothetical protein AMATHDRAFT_1553 [Amanita thiersii Skay4041]
MCLPLLFSFFKIFKPKSRTTQQQPDQTMNVNEESTMMSSTHCVKVGDTKDASSPLPSLSPTISGQSSPGASRAELRKKLRITIPDTIGDKKIHTNQSHSDSAVRPFKLELWQTKMPLETSQNPTIFLDHFSEGPRRCIERLLAHFKKTGYPDVKLAAVLVLLYEQKGQLRVLLTTRAKSLRTHAGQTALPGGRLEVTDANLIETAYREAHEEVALPLKSPDIHTLGMLEPVISLHHLLVTPVVAISTNPDFINDLKASESEVSCIFSHPLEALLTIELLRSERLMPLGSEDWPYDTELYHTTDVIAAPLGNTTYRMHRFRSSASPVKGLTSDILIKTAEIAYNRPPNYERYAPNQIQTIEEILRVITKSTAVLNHS